MYCRAQETGGIGDYSETVRQALELLKESKYRAAADLCRGAAKLAARDEDACQVILAYSFNSAGKHKKAIEILRPLAKSTNDRTVLAMANGERTRYSRVEAVVACRNIGGRFRDQRHYGYDCRRQQLE